MAALAQLYAFRYRDPQTGRWVRARRRATIALRPGHERPRRLAHCEEMLVIIHELLDRADAGAETDEARSRMVVRRAKDDRDLRLPDGGQIVLIGSRAASGASDRGQYAATKAASVVGAPVAFLLSDEASSPCRGGSSL